MRVLVRLSLRVLLRVLVGAEVRVLARVPECVLGRFFACCSACFCATLSVCFWVCRLFQNHISREKWQKRKMFSPSKATHVELNILRGTKTAF